MSDTIIFSECASGFFSTCSIILFNIVDYFNNNKKLPLSVDSKKMFEIYKTNIEDDIFNSCFYTNNNIIEYNIPITFSKTQFEPQFSDYKLINYEYLDPFIKKYFNPTKFITSKIEYLKNNYIINNTDNFCGVFYRGNDKIKETQKPSYQEIVNKALEMKINNENIKFIIQTDEYEFLEYFLKEFPDAIYFKEIPVIQNSVNTNVGRVFIDNTNKLDILGFYLASIYIFSSLKNIITTSGNGEIFITFFRGNSNGIHQYLKKNEYIHGIENREYDPYETKFWF